MMDSISSDRSTRLSSVITASSGPCRPLLTHLNNDNSWLLSLPIPELYQSPGQQPRTYFHIVIDPWLTPSNNLGRWFLLSRHSDVPARTSIKAVERLISDIECASGTSNADPRGNCIDAVITTHTNTDHTDKGTLLQMHPSVPVYSRHDSAKLIKSWKHFDNVYTLPRFGKDGVLDWRTPSEGKLPPWLNFWHLGWKETTIATLHVGLMISWEDTKSQGNGAECLVLAPHGILIEDVKVIAEAEPAVKPLAILHTTKKVWDPIGRYSNLGSEHGLRVMREAKPKYWIPTHDEMVNMTGVYSWFVRTLEVEDVQVLKTQLDEKAGGNRNEEFELVLVGNGESFVLA